MNQMLQLDLETILVWKKNKKNAKLVSAEIDLNVFFGPKAAINFNFFKYVCRHEYSDNDNINQELFVTG